jgi:hypothetical protein
VTPLAVVFIDETNGAATSSGQTLTPKALAAIAEAVQLQANQHIAPEFGGVVGIRVGTSSTDVRTDETVCAFAPTLPDVPGASAYHDQNGKGVPVIYVAVTTCDTVLGQGSSVSVDVSHEIAETLGDPGCNQLADDGAGTLHARELCDAVEMQTYPYVCKDGTIVWLSNFLLPGWFVPGSPGPYDYMSMMGLSGAVAPPGPMQTAPGNGGNYQITAPFSASGETQVTGTRRKGAAHWTSRAARRGIAT